MSEISSALRRSTKNAIRIDEYGATHRVGTQSFSYAFFSDRGRGSLVGSKSRNFEGIFKKGVFELFGGLGVETIAFDRDPSHAGVATPRTSLIQQREEAVSKMELLRELAIEMQSELRAAFDAMTKELVAENSKYDILAREDQKLKAWSVRDKIYIEEFRGEKVWLSPYEYDEPYEDAVLSVRERVADY